MYKYFKVQISDEYIKHKILNIADGKVTFIAKDYRDRAVKKPVTLDGTEFMRRFVQHILPRRFVKIRGSVYTITPPNEILPCNLWRKRNRTLMRLSNNKNCPKQMLNALQG